MSRNPHIGSSFDSFLAEEGILEDTAALAAKRVIAWQVAEAMKSAKLTKSALARRMNTSRSQLDRVLDATDTSLTLDTLSRAATALGYRIQIDLVAAQSGRSVGKPPTAKAKTSAGILR